MVRVFILFSVIIATTVFAEEIESNFYREESCSDAKGYCVLETECPHSVDLKHKSLCPNQKKDGAICCHDFPSNKVNCFQQHNDCQKTCLPNLNLGRKGCPTGESCCVLV